MTTPTLKSFSEDLIGHGIRTENLCRMEGWEIENTLSLDNITSSIYLRVYSIIEGENALSKTTNHGSGELFGEGRFISSGRIISPKEDLVISICPFKLQFPKREEIEEIDFFLHSVWRPSMGSINSYNGMYLTKIYEQFGGCKEICKFISEKVAS